MNKINTSRIFQQKVVVDDWGTGTRGSWCVLMAKRGVSLVTGMVFCFYEDANNFKNMFGYFSGQNHQYWHFYIQMAIKITIFCQKLCYWPSRWSPIFLKLCSSWHQWKTIPLTLLTPLLALIIASLAAPSIRPHPLNWNENRSFVVWTQYISNL